MSEFLMTLNKVRDNVEFFKQNSENDYVAMINKIIDQDPFNGNKFYIFSFVKRVDDVTGVKKMYHQARLTKPHPVPGATLIRVDPKKKGDMTIMWSIPNQETFGLYSHGKMFANEQIYEWIKQFNENPDKMCEPEKDDLNDLQIKDVYQSKYKKKKAILIS